jgi:hypothetical protein
MKILLIEEGRDHFGSKHLLINITSKEDYLFRSFYDRTEFEVKALSFLIRVEMFQT